MKSRTNVLLAGALSAMICSTAPAAEQIKMATIAPGSSAYLVMTTMASIINQNQKELDIKVDATGAATKHVVETAQGKLDVCMSSPIVHKLFKSGKAMYKKMSKAPELSKNLGLLFWFPYGAYHVLTYADSGINSLQDIKGKKVFLGPPGGGAWNTARGWIQAQTGYKPGKDYENVKASWAAGLQGFQDRQFDVYINGGIPPFPQVEQLALTSEIRILGLNKAQVAKQTGTPKLAGSTALGRSLDEIPAGIYGKGVVNNESVYTLGSNVGVVARMDLSTDTVYTMTKTFWTNIEAMYKTAPYMKKVTLEGALVADNIKLHPGALKYYQEIGLTIPAAMM